MEKLKNLNFWQKIVLVLLVLIVAGVFYPYLKTSYEDYTKRMSIQEKEKEHNAIQKALDENNKKIKKLERDYALPEGILNTSYYGNPAHIIGVRNEALNHFNEINNRVLIKNLSPQIKVSDKQGSYLYEICKEVGNCNEKITKSDADKYVSTIKDNLPKLEKIISENMENTDPSVSSFTKALKSELDEFKEKGII